MIKDEMSDDAEFEAFLKGEGALARQLRAIRQPSSPPSLDAAILAAARAALTDPAPSAANDAAPAGKWSPPPALSWRWRVPAGIAAALLVGVIARQSFESDHGDLAVPPAAVYEQAAPPPAEMPLPPPPPAAAQAEAAAAAPQAAAPPPRADDKIAAVRSRVREKRAPASAASKGAPAPEPVIDRVPMPAPVPAPTFLTRKPVPHAPPPELHASPIQAAPTQSARPAPSAAPIPSAPAPAPARASLDRVFITGSSIAAPAERSLREQPRAEPGVEMAPRKSVARGAKERGEEKPRDDGLDELMMLQKNAGTGNAASLPSAAMLLERVERLLEAGDQVAALASYEQLRRLYPDYPVPDSTREKLSLIKP